jgi:hypothetical protein
MMAQAVALLPRAAVIVRESLCMLRSSSTAAVEFKNIILKPPSFERAVDMGHFVCIGFLPLCLRGIAADPRVLSFRF